ncbi:MAG TPA: hypothetical protein VIJ27_00005, partial [Mucilaginibacter sp.]
MKIWPLTFLLIIFCVKYNYAQKLSLVKWVSHTVDSLQTRNIDTIEYYRAYCNECIVSSKPPMLGQPTDTLPTHQCDIENGGTERVIEILYKQNNKYYSLTFNCSYPPIKKELKNVKSIDYFLSIVPILVKRDRYGAAIQTKRKFNPPIMVDGGYEEAFLYCGHIKQRIFMQDDQKTDKGWRYYFWIDKQTKLLSLLESET